MDKTLRHLDNAERMLINVGLKSEGVLRDEDLGSGSTTADL